MVKKKKNCLLFEVEKYGEQNKKSSWKQNKLSASFIRWEEQTRHEDEEVGTTGTSV